MRLTAVYAVLILGLWLTTDAMAVPWCGGVYDSCDCGAPNPYPCCDNGNGKSSNCTWGAWHHACCDWGKALPGWSHAKFWAGNAKAHPGYEVHEAPQTGAIGCRTLGKYGHVAYVTGVNGSQVSVHEQCCCEGAECWPNCSYCIHGFRNATYPVGYFNGGYIVPKGGGPVKYCGDGSCNNGENCSSCPQDCGSCCGNGKCEENHGENCSSCPQDCGSCCGNGKCEENHGENCSSCPQDCGSCCGNGKCEENHGENCSSCPQDCGSCCGNGKCEENYGEKCDVCVPDCGVCNKPPIGEVEKANCQVISGWALDPDVDWPIEVKVLANGKLLVEKTADEDNVGHPGRGFSVPVGRELKDGQVYTIEVIAKDDKGELDSVISGSGKKFICRNGVEVKGIWRMEYHDAAGVDISPVEGEPYGWTVLKLFHLWEGFPNSGNVSAFAEISNSQFDRVSARVCGGFASPSYAGSMSVDGDEVTLLGLGIVPCVDMEWTHPGVSLGAALAALGVDYDSSDREIRLEQLSFWSRGWKFGYSWDSTGLSWSNPSADKIVFSAREGVTTCTGSVLVTRDFESEFQGIEFAAQQVFGSGPALVIGNGKGKEAPLDSCVAQGHCFLVDFPGSRLDIRMECGEGKPLPEGWTQAVAGLRVFRNFEENLHSWLVTGNKVWGLAADLPLVLTPGLAVRISTQECDYVPYGSVHAVTTLPSPEVEAVRGMLSYSLPGECYQGFLTIDEVPVEHIEFGQSTRSFELRRNGSRLGVALTATEGCGEEKKGAFVEIYNTSYLRKGWWTTPTPVHAGIRDSRPEGCSLRFENLKWWGMAKNEAQGTLLVHRFLEDEYSGIRYQFSHTFEGPFYKLRLLLDGKPVKEHSLQTPSESAVEVTGRKFSEVGFQFSVAIPGTYPFKWKADVQNVEVLRAAQWTSICEAAEAGPDLEGVSDLERWDVVSSEDHYGGPEGEDRGGGCSSGSGNRGLVSFGIALALLLALVIAIRAGFGNRKSLFADGQRLNGRRAD